jgi:hypothetical protein|uniref:RING-type domain-containing protein n=1 Tax=viral metagenome TaxID=1070528 RepID=A0A6C0CYZ7_9ZZZZ
METEYSISGVYQHPNILENQNNLELCSICLEYLNENEDTKPYQCTHLYHSNCINNWHGNCPTCRAEKSSTTLTNNNNNTRNLSDISEESIEGFKRCHQRIPTNFHFIYHQKWKKNDCVRYNHNLIFLKPYGVVGICEDCKIIQCFNLSHPI